MRRPVIVACVIAITIACHRSTPAQRAQPFDRNTFITTTLQSLLGNNDIGALAAHRGRLPETRQLGATLHREQKQLFAALSEIAQRKRIVIPQSTDEKKIALEENLVTLPGQVFDRAYALAMLQDLNGAIGNFNAAASCGDRDIEAFAKQNLPLLVAEQRSAAALLNRAGGSPFGFVPP